jgi:hypothetical protein
MQEDAAVDGDARDSNGNAQPAIAQRWPRIRQWLTLISAVIAAIGVAAAGIGYIKDGAQFVSVIEGYFRDKSELSSFVAAAAERLGHNDYEAAMAANAKARKLAPRDPSAAAQQAQIAMIWLEDMRISSADGPQSFAAVVDPLKAVLVERLAKTEGAMKADIQAHIGWANFLRSRDGYPAIDVVEEFDAAIAKDPNNLYGHVMRGFWTLWRGEPINRARADFNVAMQSVTNPAFSDSLIMASLTNVSSDEFMAGAVEYADAIRRAGRNLDDPIKRRLISYYSSCVHDKPCENRECTVAKRTDGFSRLAQARNKRARRAANSELFRGLLRRARRRYIRRAPALWQPRYDVGPGQRSR